MTMHVDPRNLAGTKMFQRGTAVSSAFLKMGIAGFASGGKTKTSGIVAIGLVKLARELRLPYADRPVFMLDTETGSDFVRKDFEAANIEFVPFKTRAFSDLVPAIKEAQSDASVLMIDSETHYWREFCKTYQKERARKLKNPLYKLQMLDWAFLKNEWSEFTDTFVNSQLHIIKAGRGSFEFDMVEDEEGRKELQKTDVKMASEKESAFEPSLLVWMDRRRNMQTMQAYRTATILKDRADLIDGQEFTNPTFDHFMPHIRSLNLGGKHVGFDAERTSAGIVPGDTRELNSVKRKIILGEIEELLVSHYPGQTAEHKRNKVLQVRKHFQAAWPEIESVMSLPDLRAGYSSMYYELEGKLCSKYAPPAAEPPKAATIGEQIGDGIPEFLRRTDVHKANGQATDPNWMEDFVS